VGLISRAIDKIVAPLPTWTKMILLAFVVAGSVYLIARDGFISFLLRAIFSPDL
jgi:hypothetical protein